MSNILGQNGNADQYCNRIPFKPSQRTIIKKTDAVKCWWEKETSYSIAGNVN
jgi:hypothetical protein